MALQETSKNKIDQLSGKAKETLGAARGDRDLQVRGMAQQAQANVRQAGNKLVEAGQKLREAVGL